MPLPYPGSYPQHTAILSSADDPAQPSERLVSLALTAIQEARSISYRDGEGSRYDPLLDLWPGEHYRLLGALVTVLEPRLIVEIGTGTGLSALAMLRHLPQDGHLVTFDVVGWRDFGRSGNQGWAAGHSHLQEGDFGNGRLVQHVADLSYPEGLARHRDLLAQADIVFIDAAKDGTTEDRLLAALGQIPFQHPPIVLLDDIRFWNMLRPWREITHPKLDLTSFGHWSGTGIVEWVPAPLPAGSGSASLLTAPAHPDSTARVGSSTLSNAVQLPVVKAPTVLT